MSYNNIILFLLFVSGFGIVFLNEESILALCFFIFIVILFRNSDSAAYSLEETRQIIKRELDWDMLDALHMIGRKQEMQIHKKTLILYYLHFEFK